MGSPDRISDSHLRMMQQAQALMNQAQAILSFVTTFLFQEYNLPPDAIIQDDGTIAREAVDAE